MVISLHDDLSFPLFLAKCCHLSIKRNIVSPGILSTFSFVDLVPLVSYSLAHIPISKSALTVGLYTRPASELLTKSSALFHLSISSPVPEPKAHDILAKSMLNEVTLGGTVFATTLPLSKERVESFFCCF